MTTTPDQAMTVRDVAGVTWTSTRRRCTGSPKEEIYRDSRWLAHGASRDRTSIAGSICRKKLHRPRR